MRGPEYFRLRHRVLPAHLARAAHHEQVARRGREVAGLAAAFRAQQERTARAEGHDRDARVAELAQLAVGVPGDAVVAVAVVVARGAGDADAEQLVEGPADVFERGVGKRIAAAVPVREARVVEHAVVHTPAPLLPLDLVDHHVEQRVGAEQPAARDVDPRRVVELDAIDARLRVEARLAVAEQRPLQHGHDVEGSEHTFVLARAGQLERSRTPASHGTATRAAASASSSVEYSRSE